MIGHDNGAGLTARATHRIYGAPDGEPYPRWFEIGAILRGDLARAEVEAGRAEWLTPPKIETKAPAVADGPFPTGAAERSSSARAGQASGKKTSRRRAGRSSS